MLNALGYSDLQEFIADVVPADILDPKPPVDRKSEAPALMRAGVDVSRR